MKKRTAAHSETGADQIAKLAAKPGLHGRFTGRDDPRRNNAGRPKRKSMTAHLAEALTDDARRKIAEIVVRHAKAGDMRAVEFAYSRIDGNVAQKLSISFVIRKIAEERGLPANDPRVLAAIAEAERIVEEAGSG